MHMPTCALFAPLDKIAVPVFAEIIQVVYRIFGRVTAALDVFEHKALNKGIYFKSDKLALDYLGRSIDDFNDFVGGKAHELLHNHYKIVGFAQHSVYLVVALDIFKHKIDKFIGVGGGN